MPMARRSPSNGLPAWDSHVCLSAKTYPALWSALSAPTLSSSGTDAAAEDDVAVAIMHFTVSGFEHGWSVNMNVSPTRLKGTRRPPHSMQLLSPNSARQPRSTQLDVAIMGRPALHTDCLPNNTTAVDIELLACGRLHAEVAVRLFEVNLRSVTSRAHMDAIA